MLRSKPSVFGSRGQAAVGAAVSGASLALTEPCLVDGLVFEGTNPLNTFNLAF